MKIYLDLIFILNFAFDFIMLFSTSILLSKRIIWKRIIIASIIGTFSILFLFLPLNTYLLLILKLLLSIIMIRICFKYSNISMFLKELLYFYLIGIILGGVIYFLNIQFAYKNKGLVFFYNGLSINFIIILLFAPIVIYFYIKDRINFSNTYKNIYLVKLVYNNHNYNLKGYVDTANRLKDPYKKRSVILIEDGIIDFKDEDILYIPYQSLNNRGVLKCVRISSIYIDNKRYSNLLLGQMKDKFNIEDVNCILPNIIKGD